jgi:5-(carboxyamino)imidazole ribonucleotide synthase
MTFPNIGLIADEIVKNNFKQEADKLGIGIKFIEMGLSTEKIIELSKDCNFICVDPNLISISSLKSIERSGVMIYPPISAIESIAKLNMYPSKSQMLSIVVTRSPHAQISTWPITLITENVLITPAPAISNEQAIEIQLSTINLANEIQLIGGLELIVDADDFKKLIGINWINPLSSHSFSIGSVTGYFEQYLRAVLDLPLGNSTNLNSFIVTGNLFTDINSDDYRPYLHLMARNPNLKFDQLRNKVGLLGDNLENMLTEVIHAQQYYCGEIDE